MTARYSIIPARAIHDANLTHLDLRVLGCIGYHLSREGNEAYPKQSTIAEKLGVTREAVNRSIARLRDNGYVRVVATKRADGGNGVSVYHVILDPREDDVIAGSQGSSDRKDHSPCDRTGSQPNELPIGTPSVAKATGEDADLFGDDPPPKPKPSPPPEPKPDEDPYKRLIFTAGLALFKSHGHREPNARAFLGRLLKLARDDTAAVANAITAAERAKPADLQGWLLAAMRKRIPGTPEAAKASAEDGFAELERRFAAFAKGERWRTHWGPAPDGPDAIYPAEFYTRYGITPWTHADAEVLR